MIFLTYILNESKRALYCHYKWMTNYGQNHYKILNLNLPFKLEKERAGSGKKGVKFGGLKR